MEREMSDWKWWVGQGGERYTSGPHDSREQAIEAGREEYTGDAFDICEAKQDPLKVSDWIDADRMLEWAEEQVEDSERVCWEFDDPPYFPVKPDQEKDLVERIKRACDEWQEAHCLVFTVSTFSAVRNHETIPEDAMLAERERKTNAD
jgi:hypothetical protein